MKHFLALTLATTLSVVWLCAPAAGQDTPPVKEIRVEGNQRLTERNVLDRIRLRIGATYDESIVRQDERRLLETGKFSSVHATRTYTEEGVIVTFVVQERPLVGEVVIEGNKAFTDAQLSAELTFGEGDPLNVFAAQAGRTAIEDKYRREGYHFATVELDAMVLRDAQRVVYTITEGPKVTLRKIRFQGNEFFTGWRLRQAVGSSARFWPFIPGRLDIEQADLDVQSLRNLYVSEGFLDVQVGRLMEFSEDKRKATLIFVIEQGPRFRVAGVEFEGNTVFSGEELASRLKLQRGEFLTSEALRLDTDKIENSYGELGYIEAQATSSRRFRDPTAAPPDWAIGLDEGRPALVTVVFHVKEQDQYRLGAIDIRGNTITQERIIRRELRFFPEQLYNKMAVDESQRRLMETRLFEKVTITPVGREEGVRQALVEITEGRTAQFLIGVGVSTNSGLLGNVSFTQRNFDLFRWPTGWGDFIRGKGFRGAGQTLSIVAEPGTDLMRFSVDWFEPALFDQPYSLGTRAFFFTRQRENYDEQRYGGVVSLGHRFKNRWYGELSSRIEGIRLEDMDSDAPPEVLEDAGSHVLLGLKGSLVRDRTDSRWMPSTGDRFHFSYEQVVGSYRFSELAGDYRIYRTLHMDALDRKHILAGRLAAGHIFGDAPVFERYYGGGIGSVRGFQFRGISPRSAGRRTAGPDGVLNTADDRFPGRDEPIGGDFMCFAGTEYTFPIFGEQLRGVLFLDSGTVEEEFQITTYRVSAGFGIRWVIPLFGPVPMSLDFGFPISKAEEDDTQLISFTFGATF